MRYNNYQGHNNALIAKEMKALSTELKRIREEKKITQEALAQKSKISIRSYKYYERGKRRPGIDTARKIAEALGQTVDEVFPAKQQ